MNMWRTHKAGQTEALGIEYNNCQGKGIFQFKKMFSLAASGEEVDCRLPLGSGKKCPHEWKQTVPQREKDVLELHKRGERDIWWANSKRKQVPPIAAPAVQLHGGGQESRLYSEGQLGDPGSSCKQSCNCAFWRWGRMGEQTGAPSSVGCG